MKAENKQKYLGLSLLFNSCVFFSFFSFTLWCLSSLVVSMTSSFYLKPLINLSLIAISFLISIIISLIMAKKNKPYLSSKFKVLYYLSTSYVTLYFIYNLLAFILDDIWTVFAVISIFISSLLFSILESYAKIHSVILNAVIYFIVFAIPYFITTFITDYLKGNKIFIIFAIYLLSYAFVFTLINIIKLIYQKHKNSNTKYENMF